MADRASIYEKAAEVENLAAREAREAKKSTSPQVAMPFGKRVDAGKFLELRPYFQPAGVNLAKPEELLKSPELDKYVYAWPDSESVDCQAKINSGVYIPVKKTELKENAAIATHKGSDQYVHWYRHILVKIPKEYATMMYDAPKAWATARLARHEEWYMEQVSAQSKGLAEGEIQKGSR